MDSVLGELLARRRMCRDFEATPLPPDTPESLADAATRAPAAGNTHALDLVVLEGVDTTRYWDVTLPPARRDGFAWPGLLDAPLLMIPYVDPGAYAARYSEADKAGSGLGDPEEWDVPYWFVDGGAALMAMLLTAEELGLGALLFGQFDHEGALKRALGVPPERVALGTLAVGHPRRGGNSRSRSARRGRAAPAETLHRGRW